MCDKGYVGDGRVCYGTVQQVRPRPSARVCADAQVPQSICCFQELMVLQDASEFFSWTSVSRTEPTTWRPRLTPGAPCENANVVFQVSGVFESLADQNLTLLVPSSAAVAKMSSEDTDFWTTRGNLQSLVR